jgi:hypothetical protein
MSNVTGPEPPTSPRIVTVPLEETSTRLGPHHAIEDAVPVDAAPIDAGTGW